MQGPLRKMLICAVLIGALMAPGAVQAGEITGVVTQIATGPPSWIWDVGPAGGDPDPANLGDYLIFDMGGAWTTDVSQSGWSTPTGWDLDETRIDVIRFEVTDALGGDYGTFSVTPYGPASDNPSNHPGASGPVVPEASTMALLGLGLFAGALLKWRKKEE